MRWVIIWAVFVLATILSPTAASGITFSEWASSNGYTPGAAMPHTVNAYNSGIDSLNGIDDFDWTTTPTATLYLMNNQLSSLAAGDFTGLTKLTQLDLSFNQLSSMEADAFSGLTNLDGLNIAFNQLTTIEAGHFSGLTKLTQLDLSFNQISSTEADTFSGLTNLTRLNLTENQLSNIPGGTFSGLVNLDSLDLQSNELSSITTTTFNGLSNLTNLVLEDNRLSSVEAGSFNDLTKLQYLLLGFNQLSSIAAGTFSGLANLQRLGVSDNQLANIEVGAFKGLTNLEDLTLSNNPDLTELNLAEADFSGLQSFNLAGDLNVTRVSLKNTVLGQTSLAALMDGGSSFHVGIGELPGITQLDLSGIDFANITDLAPLYVLDDLTKLWLLHTSNLNAVALDVLLDNLATIEGTAVEGLVYMTPADFDASNTAGGGLLAIWDAEPGHRVVLVIAEPASCLLLALATGGLMAAGRKRGVFY